MRASSCPMEAWTKVVGNSRGRTSRGNRERMEEGLLLLLLLLVQAVSSGCIMILDALDRAAGTCGCIGRKAYY